MTVLRSTRRLRSRAVEAPRLLPIALATGALLATVVAANVAHAAPIDRQLFTWTGRVDREVYITMRGRDVRTTGPDANLPNRARVNDPLPRGRGDVLVRMADGRGSVDVVEQPSARNGYTTTIRIRDPRSGADNYRVLAYWSGDDRFDSRRDDRDDRSDRNDRRDDDRWGRNDDCGPNNNGRGGGWGRGGRQDCDYRPGNGNGNRDRDNRGGYDDRGGNNTSGALRWSGRVDDVVEIRISGRRVDAITRSGNRVDDVNSNIRGSGLPSRDVTLTLDRNAGRGSVQIIQQPSAWNGYTAVIRIYDPQGGASFYDFSAFWN
jgi:hypothetical protein